MKIAIVGMGFAGISVLREWTKEIVNNPSIELTVYGDKKTFGNGVPYQKDNDNLLMNVPAEFTTVVPENRDDFVEWLEKTQDKKDSRFKYYPRQLFGTYLEERMNTWLLESKANIIKEKIDNIQILSNNKFQLTHVSGTEEFDAVHLCIGNLPYKDHYDLLDHPNFIINPFPISEKLAKIPKKARVGVLGTGLTSIDLFRYFYNDYPDVKLSFFSHSGKFKSVSTKQTKVNFKCFTKENITNEKEQGKGFIPLETYIDWFMQEIEHQGLSLEKNWMNQAFGSKDNIKKELVDSEDLVIIQSLLIDMNPLLTDLWMSLSEQDKQVFLDKYFGIWGKLRSTFPAESGEKLLSAWEENKINVYDNLIEVIENKDSFEFILEDQESQTTDYLINAAGTQNKVSFDMDRMPLLSQLVNERILQAEAFGGVQVTMPELSAVSQKYGVLDRLKVHGQLISGIQFGNNSVDILSDSARAAVKDIIDKTS